MFLNTYLFAQVHVLSDNSIGPVVQVTPPTDNDNRSVDKQCLSFIVLYFVELQNTKL